MTSHHRTAEVLYESEAALRLVDQEIHELCGPTSPGNLETGNLAALPVTLEQAREQLQDVIAHVRDGGVPVERGALDQLLAAHDNVRLALSMLDGARAAGA